MTTYLKLVKGATKIKMAPPKQKYIEPIMLGTADPSEFREIVRALESRISDTAWTVVYKTLIVVHLMIREGDRNVALKYFSTHRSFFELSEIVRANRWASGDLRALERYDNYLLTRSEEFGATGIDYVREGYSSLKSVSESGRVRRALDHVESLELQIQSLIKNRYSQMDLSNELLLCGFRLLVQDLLSLYNCLNEGIITLLESFFEFTRSDAQRTVQLYKEFVDLTDDVVKYLKTGKAVGMKIPVIKHITTKLVRSLEEHLREDEKSHITFTKDSPEPTSTVAQRKLEEIRKQKKLLEQQLQNQQLLVSPSVPQQPYNPFGSQQQDTFTFEAQPTGNPFLPANNVPQQTTGFYSAHQMTPAFTGAGFGGYSNQQTLNPTQTGTNNPFSAQPTMASVPTPASHDLTNPFTQPNLPQQVQPQVQNPFQQQQSLMPAQTAPNLMPAQTFENTGYNQLGMQQQTTGYNPFQVQQLQQQQMQMQQLQQQQLQQQQQQQHQQQMYNQNPNLIDI